MLTKTAYPRLVLAASALGSSFVGFVPARVSAQVAPPESSDSEPDRI